MIKTTVGDLKKIIEDMNPNVELFIDVKEFQCWNCSEISVGRYPVTTIGSNHNILSFGLLVHVNEE